MKVYTTGQIVETYALFVDDNNTPLDPTTVKVQYRATDIPTVNLTYAGSSTSGTGYIFRTSTGAYQLNIDSSPLIGYLIWEWIATGVGQTLNSASAIILPQPVT